MRYSALVFVATLAFSFASSADDHMVDYFQAVANSDALKEYLKEPANAGWDLKSIEKKESYRCPGCHQFIVKLERLDLQAEGPKSKSHAFMTSLDIATKTISVSAKRT